MAVVGAAHKMGDEEYVWFIDKTGQYKSFSVGSLHQIMRWQILTVST